MSQPGPVLEPVQDDGVAASVVGVALWAVAGVACLVRWEDLAQRGTQWWFWTCVVGVGVGLVMVAFLRRRSRAYRAHRQARAAAGGAAGQRDPDA